MPHNKHAAAIIKTGGYGEDTKLDLKISSYTLLLYYIRRPWDVSRVATSMDNM